jgi:hypothetical protein
MAKHSGHWNILTQAERLGGYEVEIFVQCKSEGEHVQVHVVKYFDNETDEKEVEYSATQVLRIYERLVRIANRNGYVNESSYPVERPTPEKLWSASANTQYLIIPARFIPKWVKAKEELVADSLQKDQWDMEGTCIVETDQTHGEIQAPIRVLNELRKKHQLDCGFWKVNASVLKATHPEVMLVRFRWKDQLLKSEDEGQEWTQEYTTNSTKLTPEELEEQVRETPWGLFPEEKEEEEKGLEGTYEEGEKEENSSPEPKKRISIRDMKDCFDTPW